MDKENINADHDTPRNKIRSYNTLNSLYHETQQEIELLNKQIQVKDNIITELKIRLGRYESICLTAGNNEPLVIGPSKSLVESLCKEAWNPQQKIRDMELKASQQAEVNISNLRGCPFYKKEELVETTRAFGFSVAIYQK